MDRRVAAAHYAAAADHSASAADHLSEAARHMAQVMAEEEASRRHRHHSPIRRPRRHPRRRPHGRDEDDDDADDLEMGLPRPPSPDPSVDGVDDLLAGGDGGGVFTKAHLLELAFSGAAHVPPYAAYRCTPPDFVQSTGWLWFLFTAVITFLSVMMFRASRCCLSRTLRSIHFAFSLAAVRLIPDPTAPYTLAGICVSVLHLGVVYFVACYFYCYLHYSRRRRRPRRR